MWFRNYVAAVVERDIREMARVREPSAADAVLRGLAALSSQTLGTFAIAARADLPRATVDRYVGLLVIEDNSGRVVAIEIKAAASVADRDFRHLRSLRRDLGQDLLHGLVVYLGRNTLSFGDGLTAVPLAALWS